jgi:predicted LPLAT superfamily acyltransferase
MKTYVSILEDMVKTNPYSWFNFYDYWEELSLNSSG